MKNLSNFSAQKQKGFTLIEIAIVLVIIGLLLGGVLQGQQLIENSRVKSATNDFNGIAAAAFSYQDRYGRLPGDDPGAVGGTGGRGSAWPTATPPTTAGNGVIESVSDPFAPAANTEVSNFFKNLRAAGFIAGDPADDGVNALPSNPFGGLITVTSLTTIMGNLTGTKVCMGNVGGASAIALDTQLDDGASATGRFRATDDTGTPNLAPAGAAGSYSEDLTYTVCYRL